MTLKAAVKQGFRLVADSERELGRLERRTLEEVLENHVLLLLASGFLAATVSLLFSMGQGAYYNLIDQVTVDYLKLLNYSLTIAAGIFFFYLFAGTFLVGVMAFLLRGLIRRRYVEVVKLLCAALTPVLLFGWVAQRLAIGFLAWTLVLLVIGAHAARPRRT
jgi:hypothetical protein